MVRASRSRAKGSVLAERGPDSRRQRKVVGRAVGHDSATFRTVRTKSDVSATERARCGLAAGGGAGCVFVKMGASVCKTLANARTSI